MTLIGSGDDLFASEGSYDIHHATAETQDAFMLAVDVTEPKIDANTVVQPRQTERTGVLLLVFEAGGDNVFTADNLAVMKAINDKITQNSQFSEFCLRPKNASITTCELPLMPTNVFYGTEDPKLTSA